MSSTGSVECRASRNFHLLMQIANNLRQVFYTGHLDRHGQEYRKLSQKELVNMPRETPHTRLQIC